MTYFSRVNYTGNGTTTDFVVPFPYLEQDDISVTVNNQATTFTWTNDATIHISPAPANGLVVFIKRTTDIDAPKVDYTDGSTLTELDLDTSHKQEIYALQEIVDQLTDAQTAITNISTTTGNLPTVSGGDNGSILVVVGGVWTVVQPQNITVVTDYQVDGTTYKFQKKTRANVKVVNTDAESAWTDVHTGGPCS